MKIKVENENDVKLEIERYFKTLYALPVVWMPQCAKNYLWQLVPSLPNNEDIEAYSFRFNPTNEDISHCWAMDEVIMAVLNKFEYKLLSERFREKPLPWKVLEYQHRLTRQMLKIYVDKAIIKVYKQLKTKE